MIDPQLQSILDDAREHMAMSLEHLRTELNAIRAGRASPAMLEGVRVDYYGSHTPLNQLASISAPQADLLLIQPYDPSAITDIEKGIQTANMGLNPSNDGSMIRIPVPPLSEERRKDLVKTAHARGEEAKISIRNIRRDARDELKTRTQEEHLSEDMQYESEDKLQDLTDEFTGKVDAFLEKKEKEVMAV